MSRSDLSMGAGKKPWYGFIIPYFCGVVGVVWLEFFSNYFRWRFTITYFPLLPPFLSLPRNINAGQTGVCTRSADTRHGGFRTVDDLDYSLFIGSTFLGGSQLPFPSLVASFIEIPNQLDLAFFLVHLGPSTLLLLWIEKEIHDA